MKSAYFLYACLMLVQLCFFPSANLFAAEQHDNKPVSPGRSKGKAKVSEDCPDTSGLVAVANGETSNFTAMRSVVPYITDESCSQSLQRQSIPNGINFDSKMFHLDKIAELLPKASFEERKVLEAGLMKRISTVIHTENPKASALVPLVAQMVVLSNGAARRLLAETIAMELMNSEDALAVSSAFLEPVQAPQFSNLIEMGADKKIVSQELAALVEEKAILAESDSLKRVLLSLAKAASNDNALLPTFNEVTAGFNRGVQRGKSIYQANEKKALLNSAFLTAGAIKNSDKMLDEARMELDQAMGALLGGENLSESKLKKLWKDVLQVLALSDQYPLLAEALAKSLTFQSIYIEPMDQARLLSAAKNYPQLGFAVQKQFVESLNNLNENLAERTITKKAYRDKIAKHFMPVVSQILSFEQERIEPNWMARCLEENLVLSEDIEKRFPKFVLHLIDRRDKALLSSNDAGVEPILNSMAENMAVLWSLGTVQIPALNKWVDESEAE